MSDIFMEIKSSVPLDLEVTDPAVVTSQLINIGVATVDKIMVSREVSEKDRIGSIWVGVPLPGIPRKRLNEEDKEKMAQTEEKRLSKLLTEAVGFGVRAVVKRDSIELLGSDRTVSHIIMEVDIGKDFLPTQVDELIAYRFAIVAAERKNMTLSEYVISQVDKLPNTNVVYLPDETDRLYIRPFAVVQAGLGFWRLLTITIAISIPIVLVTYWLTHGQQYISPSREEIEEVLNKALSPLFYDIESISDSIDAAMESVENGDTDGAKMHLDAAKKKIRGFQIDLRDATQTAVDDISQTVGVEGKNWLDRFFDGIKRKIPNLDLWLALGVTILLVITINYTGLQKHIKKITTPPETEEKRGGWY